MRHEGPLNSKTVTHPIASMLEKHFSPTKAASKLNIDNLRYFAILCAFRVKPLAPPANWAVCGLALRTWWFMTGTEVHFIDLSECSTEPPPAQSVPQLIDLTQDDSLPIIEVSPSSPDNRPWTPTNHRIFNLFGGISEESSIDDGFELGGREALYDSDEESDEDANSQGFFFDPFRRMLNYDYYDSQDERENDIDHGVGRNSAAHAANSSSVGANRPNGGVPRTNGHYMDALLRTNYPGLFSSMIEEQSSYESLLALGERLGQVRQRGLTRDRLSLLPKFKYSTRFPKPKKPRSKAKLAADLNKTEARSAEETVNIPDTCIICMDEFKPANMCKEMPCNHLFHGRCLDRWLLKNANCPVCRHQLEIS